LSKINSMRGGFTSRKKNNVPLYLRLPEELVMKFREFCTKEHRDLSQQMEIILEDWFAQREKPPTPKVYGPGEYPPKEEVTGDTVIWPSKKQSDPWGKKHGKSVEKGV